jgi:hypothetical protein
MTPGVLILKACLVIVIAMSFIGCKRQIIVPPHLAGVWTTSEPKYLGRYLEFSDSLLIFGTGNCNEHINYIQRIESVKNGESTLYTVYYRDTEGENLHMKLTYNSVAERTMQIGNRPGVWKISGYEAVIGNTLGQLCLP